MTLQFLDKTKARGDKKKLQDDIDKPVVMADVIQFWEKLMPTHREWKHWKKNYEMRLTALSKPGKEKR